MNDISRALRFTRSNIEMLRRSETSLRFWHENQTTVNPEARALALIHFARAVRNAKHCIAEADSVKDKDALGFCVGTVMMLPQARVWWQMAWVMALIRWG